MYNYGYIHIKALIMLTCAKQITGSMFSVLVCL